MQAASYPIRRARPNDIAAIQSVERAATAHFLDTPYAYLAEDDLVSADIDLDHEYVWVMVDPADQPIGFAIAHLHEGVAHLHELDVHPAYARQGRGRQLIETVIAWARSQGAKALTLTTFDDVPWNAPYYARLGFRALDLATISHALQAVRQREAEDGLPMDHRVCMQLDL